MAKANSISRSLQIISKAQGWDPGEGLEGIYEYGMNSGHPGCEHDGLTAPAPERLSHDVSISPPGPGHATEVKPPKGSPPEPGKPPY